MFKTIGCAKRVSPWSICDLSVHLPSRFFRSWRLLPAMAVIACMAGQSAKAFTYTITDIGTLPGMTSSSAMAISGSGKIAGTATDSGGAIHAILYSNGVLTDIGSPAGGTNPVATGVNDSGQVAGYAAVNGLSHAFLYSGGQMTDLGTLGGPIREARSINNSGQVVGTSDTGAKNFDNSYVRHAFLYQNGTLSDLGGAYNQPNRLGYAINTGGEVVGYSKGGGFTDNAFLYSGGVVTSLGDLGGSSSYALAISSNSQITGYSSLAGGTVLHAFLYKSGSMADLGALPGTTDSFGYGVNASGQVVGVCDASPARPFLYSNGILFELSKLLGAVDQGAWTLTSVTAINDKGQIVGTGNHNGLTRGFLLTPGTTTAATNSFLPVVGPVGTQLTLNGSGYTGTVGVKFNGTAATFTVISDSQITTVVPAGATTGLIAVTTLAGTSQTATNFRVLYPPNILDFTPNTGPVGTKVTLTGSNLAAVTGVQFNGVNASFTLGTGTQITTNVPVGATTGPIVVANADGKFTTTTSFTVIPAPTIVSFTPQYGPVGTRVVITGLALAHATGVTFNGQAATTYGNADTWIAVIVPSGATTGPIAVTTVAGTAVSTRPFRVIPALTPPTRYKIVDLGTLHGVESLKA